MLCVFHLPHTSDYGGVSFCSILSFTNVRVGGGTRAGNTGRIHFVACFTNILNNVVHFAVYRRMRWMGWASVALFVVFDRSHLSLISWFMVLCVVLYATTM